jgi:hypothetical protein
MTWRLISRLDGSYDCWRRGADGYYLYHRQSAAGAACIHGTHRSTLLQIPAEEWKTICGRQQQPPVAATVVSALLVASTDDISESQFSGATLISRIAR